MKQRTAVTLSVALRDIFRRAHLAPCGGYHRRVIVLECQDECDSGASIVASYELSLDDVRTLLTGLRHHL
jgi:hypothetical protein